MTPTKLDGQDKALASHQTWIAASFSKYATFFTNPLNCEMRLCRVRFCQRIYPSHFPSIKWGRPPLIIAVI